MKTTLEQKQNGRLQTWGCRDRRFSRANWIWLVAGAIGLLAAGSGRAQQVSYPLPFYEPFPSAVSASGASPNGFAYENNEELGQGVSEAIGGYAACSSNVWSFGNSVSSSCGRVFSTNGQSGLEYPGLTNVDVVQGTNFQTGLYGTYTRNTSSSKSRGVSLAIPANNTNAPMSLYASFLLNIQTNVNGASTQPYPFFGLTATGTATSVSQTGAAIYLNTAFQLQLSKNSTTASTNATAALVVSNTYLIVLRYKYNTGGNDQVDLWVDPVGLGGSTAPAPTLTITNNANLASNYFGAVAIYESGNPPLIFIDEIRVATNWAGVTPTVPAPGVIYNVTGGGAGCAGESSFPVGLSGSDSGVTYFLYTNGLPTGQSVNGTGSAITFGPQETTATYTALGSNNTTLNVGWMAGDAAVTVLAAPSITTEPIPVVVATNGLAVFTAVTPSAGSGFQWFRNGTNLVDGGNISGSQTPTLVISPAGTGDALTTANGYYLVVTNQCGAPSYSTTNALTLDAPAAKYWVGDGVSNIWDAAVTANWATASGGTATQVFNFGDNVIFDDTGSATPNITLNSSYLSPSTITINGSQNNYLLGGPGALAGPGSIVMNSTATLTLDTPNTETGGIVISNGTVTFARAAYLGQGIITLAGGQLASPNIGAVTIANQINVISSNSVIGVNSTGGQNLTLTNTLNGISGSLTFVNNSTKASTPLIILTCPSFTFNLPVDLSFGTLSGNGFILAAENTSGVQAWNGVITDAGQIERNGTGGTTLLNNTNTFTGNVLLYTGSIGVGASTVFNPPGTTPAILSGPLGTGTLTIETAAGTPALFASGGPQMVGNNIAFAADVAGPALVINGSNNLTLAGDLDLYGTNRTLEIDNTGAVIMSGVILDSINDGVINSGVSVAPGAFTKTGAGALYLDCVETNSLLDANSNPIIYGAITNSAGAIAGSGTLGGPIVVLSGGAIGAGDPGQIGTLTISNNLTLQGSANFRISKNGGVKTNDLIAGISNVVYGGTLVVTNTGTNALAVNDTFKLFSAASSSGNFTSITGGAASYTFDPAEGVLTVASLVPTNSTNITFSVSGVNSSLTLSWPASYIGWTLQTNALDVANTNDWFPYPGSGSVTSEVISISQNNSNVFFRLVGP
jgi:hypothetical protein